MRCRAAPARTDWTATNSANDRLSINYANDATAQYHYDPLGQATQFGNANGKAIDYTYDSMGLLATMSFAGGTSFTYTHDVRGNLTRATDAAHNVTAFHYDHSNNPNLLTEVDYSDGTWLKFSYDVVGQRTRSIDQTGFTVEYDYDALGRLLGLRDGDGNPIVGYTYDAVGDLVAKDMGNGTRTVYTYDADHDVLSITNYAFAGGPVNSFDVHLRRAGERAD